MKQLISNQNPLITTKITLLPSSISPTHQLKSKSHLKNSIISAKWGKKRSGSQNSRNNKLIFNAITSVASNLKILPEPFDSLVKEILVVSGGGNGGKIRFKNGFGGGGGGGNGGRRNKAKKLGFWIVLVISIGSAFWVVLEREKGNDLGNVWGFWVSAAIVFAYCLWRREIRDWVLGFSCGAALMGLGFMNNEKLGKSIGGLKANFRNLGFVSKKRGIRKWI